MKPFRSASLAWFIASGSALANPPEPALSMPPEPPTADEWSFRIAPYAWLTGLNGETGVGPLVADVDSSFSDLFSSLNMAAALQFEARQGRWGIMADGFYADLGVSGSTPGPIYESTSVGIDQFTGELAAAWRVYETSNAFVDLYAGARYNSLSMEFRSTLDAAGIDMLAATTGDAVADRFARRVETITDQRKDAYQTASASRREAIESALVADIREAAEERIKKNLRRRFHRFRRDRGLDRRDIVVREISRSLNSEVVRFAEETARLEVAKLQASVDASLQNRVNRAQARVDKTKDKLVTAIGDRISSRVPTSASQDKEWVDPIFGVRAQWNIDERWFIAGKSDIGGFGVGSDLAWTLQGTVGYQINSNLSVELGYRYMDTDFQDGRFVYDIAEHGLYTGLNIRF